ncbi:MAG: hypothetical protein AB1847_19595 [bacterium]
MRQNNRPTIKSMGLNHIFSVMQILGLTAMVVLIVSLDGAATQAAGVPGISEAASGWKLTDTRVICSGSTTQIGDGAITGGHVIEATAIPTGSCSPLGRGRFQVTLTAFLPSQSIAGQKEGYWEVRGIWSITNENAVKNARGVACKPTVARGILFTEIPFNPSTGQGIINAPVTLIMSRPEVMGSQRFTRGNGTFFGNERFEGIISLSHERTETPGTEISNHEISGPEMSGTDRSQNSDRSQSPDPLPDATTKSEGAVP